MEAVAALLSITALGVMFALFIWVFFDIPKHRALEECRRVHDVYQCEWFAEARPVTTPPTT
jgi:hypothetical protein